MSQFGSLLYYEWKKIWKRKSTWITLGIILVFYMVIDGAYLFGSSYVDGEFLETHMDGAKIDLKNGRRISGRKLDNALLEEMAEAYKNIDLSDEKYVLSQEYQEKARPYSSLYETVNLMLYGFEPAKSSDTTEEKLYQARKAAVLQAWEEYDLTDAEKSYWQEKENSLSKPFIYQYAESYNDLVSMSGVYRVCMLVTFLIAICMSIVFTEEHERRTDQLILCSRLGRKQIYFAKIAAGSLFSAAVALVLLLCTMLHSFLMYGMDGFSAAIQFIAPHYSEHITIGQVFLIMSGILLLGSILTGIFTMVLSEITGSNLASMAIVTAILFAARLVPIPITWRVVSQLWNYIPINLLKFDAGFWDMRLVPLFFTKLTSWQFSPILYIVAGFLFILIGKRVYCGYQVNGR